MRPWCNSGRRGRIYTWGRRQDLGDVGRVPIGAALESCQEAARLPHRHPRRDDEGCLRLHNLPTTEQAAVIREVWGSGRRWKCRPRPWSASARLVLSRSHALRQEFDQTSGSSKCPATPKNSTLGALAVEAKKWARAIVGGRGDGRLGPELAEK